MNYTIPAIYKDFNQPKRYKIAYGGRGSGKSWAFALMLLRLAQKNNNLLILCLREIQNSINDSVYRLLVNLIGNSNGWIITKTEIIYKSTNSRFIFKGLYRNIHSIKSLEGADIAWVEEAHSVSNESLDYLIPTIRKEHSEIWFTFNPDQEDDPVYERFIANEHDDCIAKKINHADNPNFPEVLQKELDYDKRVDYEKYLWIWEGELRTQSDAQIFKGKFVVKDFEAPEDIDFYYGVDWGFANDPTTMNRWFIKDNCLYTDYEVHQIGIETDNLAELFMKVPDSDRWISRADNARPETISYMRRHGYPRMSAAPKWPGSVEDGITYIRSFEKIYIHTRCKHTADEFKLYSYHVDKKTGDITPKIEDKNNHHIDNCRYALSPLIRNKKPTVTVTDRIF